MGEVKNNYLSFDSIGLPPSINKLIDASSARLNDDSTVRTTSKMVNEKEKDTFKRFISFYANNEKYLIPLDQQNFTKGVIDEDLLGNIIRGN